MNVDVKFKKLKPEAIVPNYAQEGDIGLDLYSMEDCQIASGEKEVFALGFALEIPLGFGALVKDKGGMAKKGLHVMGGVFDAGYRGEYLIQLVNLGKTAYQVHKKDKIAQLVILPIGIANITKVDSLSETNRGDGKFGSTGR